MTHLLQIARLWLVDLWKRGGDFVDLFKPRGDCVATLYYANGPRKGQVFRQYKGRNVVTSWLSVNGAAPTAGRDLMRRILVPSTFSGSLAADPNAAIHAVQLGSGTTAETSSDTALVAPIAASLKSWSSVTFDGSNPYVTFIADFDESEVNQTISEASLLSGRTPRDFVARKVFGAFTKTSDFTLQVRWTIRF